MKGGGISFAGCIQLFGFCTFEACVGLFWPSIMKMRSQYIPEEARSTIMNFFRIPLNIFVCIVLYNVSTILTMFYCVVFFLQQINLVYLFFCWSFFFWKVNAFPITVMFGMCSIFLFMASILQRRLLVVSEIHKSSECFAWASSTRFSAMKFHVRVRCYSWTLLCSSCLDVFPYRVKWLDGNEGAGLRGRAIKYLKVKKIE